MPSPKGYKLFFYLLILCFVSACSVQQDIRYDHTYLYDESQRLIKPSFKVFHDSKDSSTLFFSINSKDVLYGKLGADLSPSTRILCKYMLYDEKGENIIDSATFAFFNTNEDQSTHFLQSSIKVAVPLGKSFPLEIRFRDEYRDLNVVNYLWIDKKLNGNSQFYLLKDKDRVLFEDRIEQEDSVQLYKSSLMPNDSYTISYSSTNFKMTIPPFSTNTIEEQLIDIDSTKDFFFVNDSIQLKNWSNLNKVQPSTGRFNPFNFHYFHSGFPEITDYQQMIEPLRYISTNTEYNILLNADNKKEAIDAFWMRISGSEANAKRALKEYYQRVIAANRYFSNYREGWKTDRGIIYIVYGKPTTIYKSLNMEKWIYGDESSLLSVSFDFKYREHSHGNSSFRMTRSEEYKNNWYRMVDNWRQVNYNK